VPRPRTFTKISQFNVEVSDESGILDYSLDYPQDITMDLDHIEHLEEQVAELKLQNEVLNNAIATLTDKIDLLVVASTPQANSPLNPVQKSHIKPSPPQEFSGDGAKGRAFLNSCELYLQLAPHQFASEHEKVSWAYSFMKSGCAALFVDCMLCSEM